MDQNLDYCEPNIKVYTINDRIVAYRMMCTEKKEERKKFINIDSSCNCLLVSIYIQANSDVYRKSHTMCNYNMYKKWDRIK